MKAKEQVQTDLQYFPNVDDLIKHYEIKLQEVNSQICDSDILSYTEMERLCKKYEYRKKCLQLAKDLKA